MSVCSHGVDFPASITGDMTRGSASRGFFLLGILPPRGVCIQFVCIQGGLPPEELCMWLGVGQTPHGILWIYGQQAGNMHPTGMHSCSLKCCTDSVHIGSIDPVRAVFPVSANHIYLARSIRQIWLRKKFHNTCILHQS